MVEQVRQNLKANCPFWSWATVTYFLIVVNTINSLLQEYLREQDRNKALEAEQDKLGKGHLAVRSDG